MTQDNFFLSDIHGVIKEPPRLGLVENFDTLWELYPVTIFRRERDLFNRIRIRGHDSQLAVLPQETTIYRPGICFRGRVTRADNRGALEATSVRHFGKKTIFWLVQLEVFRGLSDPLYNDGTMPKPLPLNVRVRQLVRRTLFDQGIWLGPLLPGRLPLELRRALSPKSARRTP